MLSRLAWITLFTAILARASPLAHTATKRAGTATVTIQNNCAHDVVGTFSGTGSGSLPNEFTLHSGQSQAFQLPSDFAGDLVFPDESQQNPYNFASTAGFSLANNYYWVNLNSGFSWPLNVVPSQGSSSGYCGVASCNSPYCSGDNFGADVSGVPSGQSNPAPSPPLYECPGSNVAYTVTTCFGTNPAPPVNNYVQLHPNGDTSKCIDVRGNNQANGTPVQIYDCNGTGAQNWVLSKGQTKVQLAGTNFCLDATQGFPPNGEMMKIWTCYDGLEQQDFWYTNDNRIALTNQGMCLDLTNGDLANSNQLQVWSCTTGNTNQVWTE